MNKKKLILIADDEIGIHEALRPYLLREDYEVYSVFRGSDVMEAFNSMQPDLVILDIMMPGRTGTQVCADIRARSMTPIIMLTAKGEEVDKLLGFALGADDYIVKPFSVLELLARVDVVLRRYHKTDVTLRVGGVEIDTLAMTVTVNGAPVSLTRKEYDLLLLFARNPGVALYRETIYERVWNEEFPYGSKTVDLHIQRLRRKVGWEDKLQAVNKVGYRLDL